MATVGDIIKEIETLAPPSYQESYDNAGLIVGEYNWKISGIIISLDCIESVVDEAINKKCNLIICHHPIIFGGLKKLNGKTYVERTVIKAIKHDIAIYAAHTNLDHVSRGVSFKMAEKLLLRNVKILQPKKNILSKLEVFVPQTHTSAVAQALGDAGAGKIGNYSHCNFSAKGTGQFMPMEGSQPTIGKLNELEKVEEMKIEVLFPNHLKVNVIQALKKVHPYEEVAYYITELENENPEVGSGAIGDLPNSMESKMFLDYLKDKMKTEMVRFTSFGEKKISKIALCGGAGSFLLKTAISQGADAFISGDFKYHEFFDAEDKIMIGDIGHFESEQYTSEIFFDIICRKFPNIAVAFTEVNTNPVKYY